MIKIFHFVIILFAVNLLSCSSNNDHYKYSPENSHFEIYFEGKPSINETTFNYDFGTLNWTQVIYHNKFLNIAFGVNHTQYNDSILSTLLKSGLKQFYDGLEKQSEKQISGEVVVSKSFEISGLTGREVKYTLQGGKGVVNSRILLNGTELYVWMTSSTKENAYHTSIREYLNRMKITIANKT